MKDDIVVGLDIGTTKVCAVIGEVKENNQINIIGLGLSDSHGLRKGVVVNLESTTKSIGKAIDEAQLMAGVDVGSVYAGIAGGHIKSMNSHGVIAVNSQGNEISESDVERVIDAAKALSIPMDREVIHVIPQDFIIDGQAGIKDPIGMSGVRLEAVVHIVTGAVTSAQNIVKSVNRAGYAVDDIVLEPLAASYAVLNDDEKELGVMLLDIGGGTADIAIFNEGSIWHTEVVSLGGENITRDISVGLRTPMAEAEKIKIKYGAAIASMVSEDEIIEIPNVGGLKSRTLSRHILCEIIEPRITEIFELVKGVVKKTGYDELIAGGVVLTGGTANMQGIAELGEKILEKPVRIGVPKNVGGLVDVINNPMYSAGVGLVFYGTKNMEKGRTVRFSGGDLFRNITNRMKEWFGEIF